MAFQSKRGRWYTAGTWLLLAVLLFPVACRQPGDLAAEVAQQGSSGAPGAGDLAPDFITPLLVGDALQLSTLRGQPVVIYFWATWCGSCVFDFPIIDEIYQQQKATGLVILAVNIGQDQAEVQKFVTEGGYTVPVGLDGNMDIGRAYRLLGFPSTYFIDREGAIQHVRVGPISPETFSERLAQLR
jgi:thiol-disulfide isomerase/thioredoxin